MARRALPLALLATLAVAGCSYGEKANITPDQEQARVQLLKDASHFSDRELARLCPGLYPSDFLTNTGKYGKERRDRKTPPVTAQLRAQIAAAGCDVPSPK